MSRRVHKSGSARDNRLPHQVRIVGGRWRGRKLLFPSISAIRPSPDRVRETLFNWLQHDVVGSRCLDLFAGSGALGIEALSRGAEHVSFVDREPKIGRYLRETLERLDCKAGEVFVADSLTFLKSAVRPFDIVFLDPPFDSELLVRSFAALQHGWFRPNAWVYVECDVDTALKLPETLSVHRTGRAGQVGYHLLRVTSSPARES